MLVAQAGTTDHQNNRGANCLKHRHVSHSWAVPGDSK